MLWVGCGNITSRGYPTYSEQLSGGGGGVIHVGEPSWELGSKQETFQIISNVNHTFSWTHID